MFGKSTCGGGTTENSCSAGMGSVRFSRMETTPAPFDSPFVATRKSSLSIVPPGLLTTALALFGVWLAGRGKDGTNIMGWYADYVLPYGAILVGVVAGLGYGLASWFTGVRVNRKVMLLVLTIQFGAYWTAKYLDFREYQLHHETSMGFLEYYNFSTVNLGWIPEHEHDRGDKDAKIEPLGMWGYGLRALEIAGFLGGAAIVLGALIAKPYCEGCRIYMKTKKLPNLPASIPVRKEKDQQAKIAYDAEQQKAVECGSDLLQQMLGIAKAGDVEAFRQFTSALAPSSKKVDRLPRRIAVRLVYCHNCGGGHLAPSIVTGQGKATKRATMPVAAVPKELVRGAIS
jgi:hypothetical protein